MKEYEVTITKGEPKVPQKDISVTQYSEWRWAIPTDLMESAKMGSLCSQLFLKHNKHDG